MENSNTWNYVNGSRELYAYISKTTKLPPISVLKLGGYNMGNKIAQVIHSNFGEGIMSGEIIDEPHYKDRSGKANIIDTSVNIVHPLKDIRFTKDYITYNHRKVLMKRLHNGFGMISVEVQLDTAEENEWINFAIIRSTLSGHTHFLVLIYKSLNIAFSVMLQMPPLPNYSTKVVKELTLSFSLL